MTSFPSRTLIQPDSAPENPFVASDLLTEIEIVIGKATLSERTEMTATNTGSPILIQSIMQRAPLHLADSDAMEDAIDTMVSNHISSLPVVDDDRCVIGIVSMRDLLTYRKGGGSYRVGNIMTETPVTAKHQDSLVDVAALMMEHQLHHLPVVNSEKQLVGVISSIDFVRLTADGRLVPAG
jgi:CBS domain-containing protein